MDLQLEGKIALVAGSSRGIGRACAVAFLREGARVVITGRDESSLQAAAEELYAVGGPSRVLPIRGDLTNEALIKACVQQVQATWRRIDVLVANVGSGSGRRGWEIERSDWDSMLGLNLLSAAQTVRAVLPVMLEAKKGSIVLVSSIAGREVVSAPLAYSAAKAALISMGKSLSREMAPYNIRVNSVAPGNTLFPGGSWERKFQENPGRWQRYVEAEVPMARFGRPEEVADAVVFLASERASFITGACLVVDGGQSRS